MEVEVKVKKLDEKAKLPTYATDGSGAFDIYASRERYLWPINGKPAMIETGLAMEIPEGWMMLIVPRSSIGYNTSLRMPHSIGVIDSDYRGEIKVMYENKLPKEEAEYASAYVISEGYRIAQGFLVPAVKAIFQEVDELSETDRGDGGFGSTGK